LLLHPYYFEEIGMPGTKKTTKTKTAVSEQALKLLMSKLAPMLSKAEELQKELAVLSTQSRPLQDEIQKMLVELSDKIYSYKGWYVQLKQSASMPKPGTRDQRRAEIAKRLAVKFQRTEEFMNELLAAIEDGGEIVMGGEKVIEPGLKGVFGYSKSEPKAAITRSITKKDMGSDRLIDLGDSQEPPDVMSLDEAMWEPIRRAATALGQWVMRISSGLSKLLATFDDLDADMARFTAVGEGVEEPDGEAIEERQVGSTKYALRVELGRMNNVLRSLLDLDPRMEIDPDNNRTTAWITTQLSQEEIEAVEGVMDAVVAMGESAPLTANQLVEGLPPCPETETSELKQMLVQYSVTGNTFAPVGRVVLKPQLERCAYRVNATMQGPVFEKIRPKTDSLLVFENTAMKNVLTEIDKFWGLKDSYGKLGLLHSRGLLLYGPPGTGKSCLLQQVAEMMVERGDVVFFVNDTGTLKGGLKAFREVEPDRKVVVIFEDVDEAIKYGEHGLLQLLSGDNMMENVLYLGTTNYIQKFPPRLLRPGRFDKKIYIGPPALEVREAFLKSKCKGLATDEEIARLAEASKGFSFGHLRELMVGIYALKEDPDEVIERLKALPNEVVKESVGDWPPKVGSIVKVSGVPHRVTTVANRTGARWSGKPGSRVSRSSNNFVVRGRPVGDKSGKEVLIRRQDAQESLSGSGGLLEEGRVRGIPDGTGPYGRGRGPGRGKRDGTGMRRRSVRPAPVVRRKVSEDEQEYENTRVWSTKFGGKAMVVMEDESSFVKKGDVLEINNGGIVYEYIKDSGCYVYLVHEFGNPRRWEMVGLSLSEEDCKTEIEANDRHPVGRDGWQIQFLLEQLERGAYKFVQDHDRTVAKLRRFVQEIDDEFDEYDDED
jgi:hypothetical protein